MSSCCSGQLYGRVGRVRPAGLPIYFGTFASDSPEASDVSAWGSRDQVDAAGTFEYTDIGGDYWGIAIPTSFNPPDVLYVDGFAVGMQMSTITIDDVEYRLYMSPNGTFAASLEVVVQ